VLSPFKQLVCHENLTVFMGLRRLGAHCSAVHLPHLRQDLATAFVNALTQGVKADLHTANPLEPARIDQAGHRLAVLVDQDAVSPVLHLIEHFARTMPPTGCP
jgi:hypothetical protein